jgi:pyruvate dehydrogenase E1 component
MSVDEAIVAGLYRITTTTDERPTQVRLLASGPAVSAAQEAAPDLAAGSGIAAEVWSVTSWKQLRDDALGVERWNDDHPGEVPRLSHLRLALGDDPIPVVAVSDYVSALPDQLARFIPAPFVSLGTDGYGVSDTREALRAHFGVDADGIRAAVARLAGPAGSPQRAALAAAASPCTARPKPDLVA